MKMVDEGLDPNQIENKLKTLDGWEFDGNHSIEKEYSFKNFKQALDFTNKVGQVAEENQHHPEIYLSWGKVKITITSHEAGALTEADFELAQMITEKVEG